MAVGTWLLGVLLLGVGITHIWSHFSLHEVDGAQRWWLLIPLTLGSGAMVVKRRYPVSTLAIGTGCFLFDALFGGGTLGLILVLFDLLFTAGLHAAPRVRVVIASFFILGTVALAGVAAVLMRDLRLLFFIGLQFIALIVVPLWWSGNLRQQQRLAELAESRAETERARADLAREHARDQSRLADLARQEAIRHERAGLARDVHDVIASHLSSVAIHSGAALSRPPDPEADRRALQVVREESLASLTEMRAMISLLRSPDGAADPAEVPGGLERLDRLVAGFRARGSTLSVTAEGVTGLPVDIDRAAYRIIHEALTNASKHAPRAPIRLAVRRAGDALEVSVDNPRTEGPEGAGGPGSEPCLRSGIGLVSMRERSTGLGGTFRAGPNGSGDWQVRVTLPLTSATGEVAAGVRSAVDRPSTRSGVRR